MDHEAITEWRKARVISQGDMAKRIRISQNALAKIERGEVTHPHPKTINKMSEAYEATLRQLVGFDPWDVEPKKETE